jgi:thiol-disulfide isomerase/thioredoxin
MKKLFTLLMPLFIGMLFFSQSVNTAQTAKAEENTTPIIEQKTDLYFFWQNGCPHCAEEEKFLDKMETKYPELEIHRLEITGNPVNPKANKENRDLLTKIGSKLNIKIAGVPFTLVGKEYVSGFDNENGIGKTIESKIQKAIDSEYYNLVSEIEKEEESNNKTDEQNAGNNSEVKYEDINKTVSAPFLGEIDITKLSLPMLTVVIGLLDGFNPCAMWILLFLISLLIGMGDRKRMWILGGAFILASALVYFIFLSAWLNFFQLIGFKSWLQTAIALVAFYAGYHNLKEYFTNKEAACKVTHGEKRQKIFAKLKEVTKKEKLWMALIGIVLLAFAVNLVELFCSVGFPATYTQILSLNHLPFWQYYGYITLYVFFFMLDDIIVFIIAMKTLEVTGLTTKYSRASHLIGGVLMLLIGILMLFKPEILMGGIKLF